MYNEPVEACSRSLEDEIEATQRQLKEQYKRLDKKGKK